MRGLEGNPNAPVIKAINRRIKKVFLETDLDDEESKEKSRLIIRQLIQERKRLYEIGKVMDDETLRRVKELKKQYLYQVKKYKRLGYSNAEYRARGPKILAYVILMHDCGMMPSEAIKFFEKVEV